MATQTAQAIALSTFELLELILLQLDTQTLLTAQRTCQTWHRIIQESVAIQKALFFIPMNSSSANIKVQNALLAKKFPGFFNSNLTLLANVDMLQRPEKLEAYIRPEASWRRMLVQQPPIFRIGILISCFAFSESYTFYELSVHISLYLPYNTVLMLNRMHRQERMVYEWKNCSRPSYSIVTWLGSTTRPPIGGATLILLDGVK